MKSYDIHTSFLVYENEDQIPPEFIELIQIAKSSRIRSYSPYSGYSVGASLRMKSGEIFSANNQENAAYPSGMCAERNCLFHAKSTFPSGTITQMAVVASKSGESKIDPVTPCGACRQVMIEYEILQNAPIKLILSWKNDSFLLVNSITDLLPIPFSDINLSGETDS